MIPHTAGFAPRILIVEGDAADAGAVINTLTAYYEKRSIPATCDWVNSIERSLLQVKYYDYDAAVVAARPQADETGTDFLELMSERKYRFPVIVLAGTEDSALAEECFRMGAADFLVRGEGLAAQLPKSLDNAMLRYRAKREQERLAGDLREKNQELRVMNELLARQSVRFLKLKKEQESARRLMESLLNAMSEGVVFINSMREIELLNPAAQRIFRAETAGRRLTADDINIFTGIDPFALRAQEEVSAVIFSRDYLIEVRAVEEEGAQTGRMMVLRDMTQEKEIEKLKAEFQSMVSHELRTPLTAIRGAVENFLRGSLGEITEQQRMFLTMMLRNVERQTLLINDMLDLAKLEANMMSLKVAPVQPEYVARLSYESFRYAYAEKEVKLELSLSPGLPDIYADERMLAQMLDNLLSNALKFTPKGGRVALSAESRTGTDGEAVVHFCIADNGPGVPDHLKEKIFDRYFQADSSSQRQFKGTGLGLAICRKMAALHNGSVTVADAPGGGALFTVALPVSVAARKKILLAVADDGERAHDAEVLQHEFHVITAGTDETLAGRVAETLPQLILMDYHGDGMNGSAAYNAIRKNPSTSRIPVIFLGEGLSESDKVNALKTGAADVISRPYAAAEFITRVKRATGDIR